MEIIFFSTNGLALQIRGFTQIPNNHNFNVKALPIFSVKIFKLKVSNCCYRYNFSDNKVISTVLKTPCGNQALGQNPEVSSQSGQHAKVCDRNSSKLKK